MEHPDATPKWLLGRGALGGNVQTIWPALVCKRLDGFRPSFVRERWTTPDADFIDVDWLEPLTARAEPTPLLVLFHGLEGSSSSHTVRPFAQVAQQLGWRFAIPHFRGCSGSPNLTQRAYHSGDFEEIGWMLDRFAAVHAGPRVAVGISLGGNALLRWAQEAGDQAAARVSAIAAVSSPVDLTACGHAVGAGFNRQVYTRMFLNSLRPKALAKLRMNPGLFNREKMMAARDLYAFDNLYTAPVHGFRNTEDYWLRGSAKPHMHRIRIPALVLNARNDPFVPAWSLPRQAEVAKHVTLWQPVRGGHNGFATGPFPGRLLATPQRVLHWLSSHGGSGFAHG
jgi:predicted alpha/beta-fold hydrolase